MIICNGNKIHDKTMTSYDTGSTLNHFNFSNIYIQQFPDKLDSIISQKHPRNFGIRITTQNHKIKIPLL